MTTITDRRVVFVGNCQAQALCGAYQTWIAPQRNEIVHYVASYEEADAAARETIRQADLIVLQVMDAEQKVSPSQLGARGRVVMFPQVTAFFLWPYHSGAHPRDAEIPSPWQRVFTGNFGDRWLDRRLAEGMAPDAILDRYREPGIVAEAKLDRLIELVAERQRERDAVADMRLGDWIMSRLATERVFIHIHHPNLALFQLMLREVLARMDCTTEAIEHAVAAYRVSPFPQEEPPLHPRIAEHLGLRWAPPDLRYRFAFGERLTWDSFCRRYVAHDWNEPLQRCLSRIHDPLDGPELVALADDIEAAAARFDSAEGYLALSFLRQRAGEMPAAVAAAQRALSLEPLSVPILCRHAELLMETGAVADCLAAATDLVAWQPGFAQARITLFEAYDRLGQRGQALLEARAAFAVEPHHPHIIRRLSELEAMAAA